MGDDLLAANVVLHVSNSEIKGMESRRPGRGLPSIVLVAARSRRCGSGTIYGA